MREIKFRAWKDGKMIKWEDLRDTPMAALTEMLMTNPPRPLAAFMQYTGLKDKNGVEIYEGDILEVCGNKNSGLLVEFVNAYVGGWILTHPSTANTVSLGARSIKDLKVIGNIHQNPELLA